MQYGSHALGAVPPGVSIGVGPSSDVASTAHACSDHEHGASEPRPLQPLPSLSGDKAPDSQAFFTESRAPLPEFESLAEHLIAEGRQMADADRAWQSKDAGRVPSSLPGLSRARELSASLRREDSKRVPVAREQGIKHVLTSAPQLPAARAHSGDSTERTSQRPPLRENWRRPEPPNTDGEMRRAGGGRGRHARSGGSRTHRAPPPPVKPGLPRAGRMVSGTSSARSTRGRPSMPEGAHRPRGARAAARRTGVRPTSAPPRLRRRSAGIGLAYTPRTGSGTAACEVCVRRGVPQEPTYLVS